MTSDLADVATRDAPRKKPAPARPPKGKKKLGKVAPVQRALMAGGR